MKNESGNVIGEVRQSHLAIVKRIDELPNWKRSVEKIETKVERSFEAPKQSYTQPKKIRTKRKQVKNTFKNWNLPLQPEGYLKPKDYDLF